MVEKIIFSSTITLKSYQVPETKLVPPLQIHNKKSASKASRSSINQSASKASRSSINQSTSKASRSSINHTTSKASRSFDPIFDEVLEETEVCRIIFYLSIYLPIYLFIKPFYLSNLSMYQTYSWFPRDRIEPTFLRFVVAGGGFYSYYILQCIRLYKKESKKDFLHTKTFNIIFKNGFSLSIYLSIYLSISISQDGGVPEGIVESLKQMQAPSKKAALINPNIWDRKRERKNSKNKNFQLFYPRSNMIKYKI